MGNCGTLFLETGSKTSQYKKLGKTIFTSSGYVGSLFVDAFVYGGSINKSYFFAFGNFRKEKNKNGKNKSHY